MTRLWSILWMPKALRELEGLGQDDRERIVTKLREAGADPERRFRRLRASPWSRLRVGDHRVFAVLLVKANRIEVHAVRHRSVAYRQ